MFLAQLAAWLVTHHHAAWVPGLFSGRFTWLALWAARHGFRFTP